ncbi:hypothetical protein F5B20DRAFT_592512 [Whalleya microplaca]|nr:hypothetical protein F5B20DRAFT_592512 [Whalleya microplaca]
MPPTSAPSHHRFSNFDSQLFALGPNASPAQAKRALEAHLSETDRRMEEAGKLGTALVQQRKELTERLKEVEKLEAEGELSTDLRQKLVEIEKDYNEVAKESARAFLPKQRIPSNEAAAGSPFVPEGKGGRRSVSPSKFEAQATGSPSKFSVPNRKVRNQPANRIHDIEFAAEISTSLIAQVRNLQGLLSEKEEELRDTKVEKSKLEYDAEGYQQRIKALDESEHRYKDENWNLETQIHDLMAKERDAADREKKLTQTLNILQAEKNATQRELDELKLSQAKLVEEHAAAIKHHDIELGTAKRNIVMADSERASMARKIEDLTGQNQELAKAVSASQRLRGMDRESILGMKDEEFEDAQDKSTPEQSPPPSPVKGTPRHSMLESETLKTSLGHAQRTIQGLRNNVHREKTEKLELKRMLQEARDDLEKLRHDPLPTTRRSRKTDTKEFKKPPPRLLGALRNAKSEVFSDDPNWEDQTDSASQTHSSVGSSIASRGSTKFYEPLTEISDHFETANETANETSDAAFETANEPATETDDFHTGAEEFSSDEDAQTETESPSKHSNFSNRMPSLPAGLTRKGSVQSTASTEDEDFPYDNQMRTPTSLPPTHQKFPLRVARGAFRRSRQASEEPGLQSSPASFQNSSRLGTPQQAQSLAAELGDFETSDNDSSLCATPSRRSLRGRTASIPPLPPLPKVIMVDSGTMTEGPDRPMSMDTVVSQFSNSTYDSTAQDMEENLAKFPSPPTSPPKKDAETAPESDNHAAELTALRTEHAEQLKQLTAENAATHAAVLESLKTQHADHLNQAQAEAQAAHAEELEFLKTKHADEINQAVAQMQSAHDQELEFLRTKHADDANSSAIEAQEAHARELETLRSTHADTLSRTIAEAQAVHAAEFEALKSRHADELARSAADAQAAHAKELESMELRHADEAKKAAAEAEAAHAQHLEVLKSTEVQGAHAQELEALKATFTEQMSQKELESKDASARELEALKESELKAAHDAELEALSTKHTDELSTLKQETAHSAQIEDELETLKSTHAEQLDKAKQDSEAAYWEQVEAMRVAHLQQIQQLEEAKATMTAAHAQELESMRQKDNDVTHAATIAALVASHSKEVDTTKAEGEAKLSRELAALKEAHAQEIDSLNGQHAAAHAGELESFKAALNNQIESSKTEGDAAHTAQIEALNAAHREIIDAHKRDSEKTHLQAIESLKASHERQSKELEDLASQHLKELEALRTELVNTHTQEVEDLQKRYDHAEALDALKKDHEAVLAQRLHELADSHAQELEGHRQQSENTKSEALAALLSTHAHELDDKLHELAESHSRELESLRQESENAKSEALAALIADEYEAARLQEVNELKSAHVKEVEELTSTHGNELDALRAEHESALYAALENAKTGHIDELESHRKLRSTHAKALDALQKQPIAANHSRQLDQLKRESEATLAQELDTANANYTTILESHRQEYAAEKEEMLAEHAAELEALRKSLSLRRPALGFSSLSSVETEPVDSLRSPRREGFIIPREERPQTPPLGRKGKSSTSVVIAEDETRQSPSAVAGSQTPESQRPFKEISTNTDARPSRKPVAVTSDRSSQTALTSDNLDRLMKYQQMSPDSVTMSTSRGEVTITPYDEASPSPANMARFRRPSQESLGNALRAKQRLGDSGAISAPEAIPARRPGSSASTRGSINIIEAARTGSAGGGKGTMGPPMLPASAYRNPASLPGTPGGKRPMSPLSVADSPTPRGSKVGYANVHSPTRIPVRSRHSSVSSFASEIDMRFNRGNMSMDAAGFGPGTDPRMIQAITQTMIGEYLWKYTRKTGRGEISENRHRRYFWVHPYTRTLYWSDRDPSTAGRSELKAKSVPIEAVRVVTDDNPMPPGLHRKSLIIVSPGRTIKFTCTTGQRHETWFNALSYLLLRTGNENQADVEEVAGNITQEDVEEFNPAFNRKPTGINRPRAPPSLSSYNSRTTRNDSPHVDMSMSIPTLTPTHEKEAARSGTLGRISGYWKSSTSTLGGTFNSLRTRSHNPQDSAIYEASEVHDSAEDVRHIIEQQDRDADRLENVRACCDGKHDVGTLSHTAKRGRLSALQQSHSHSHTHPPPPPSGTTTPTSSTLRSRA